MPSAPVTTVLIAVGVLAVVAVIVLFARAASGSGRHARRRPHRNEFRPEEVVAALPPKRAALIVNPTKVPDLAAFVAQFTQVCHEHDWADPLVLPTTIEQTGTAQARQAVAEGVDVVCALGGDGTIRAVATGLAGSRVPIGLLASGTGNLLARNMDLPLDDLDAAITVALTGQNAHVDVARLTLDVTGDGTQTSEHLFLVMAGMGFDAHIMEGAPEDLKNKVGWGAYILSGLKNLRGERFKAAVTIGSGSDKRIVEHRSRTIVVGNCGRLLAGITLMPDAKIDDGILDCLVLSPKTVAGWVAVSTRVLRRTTAQNERVDHYTSTAFTVRADRPEQVQIDGDPVGSAIEMRVEIWPKALLVRSEAPGSYSI